MMKMMSKSLSDSGTINPHTPSLRSSPLHSVPSEEEKPMEVNKRQPLSLEEMIAKKEEETKAQSKARAAWTGEEGYGD